FKYLNWNTTNEGLAVTDYEFIVNRTGRGGKRPDYTLQLDGQHLLVMDAKQVKYSMQDPRWLNQVYAYGYSTQNLALPRRIDFAVLSDFEEFVVLDCTLHVNDPRALRNFLVLNWTCDDYVNQFDRLWDLFERENMRRTARTRHSDTPRGLWALALSPRKVKANRTPPDKAFLADMDNDKNGWRVRLAKDMKKLNPAADGNLITAAVQLLIDRLIFIKALSDREIEDDYLDQLAATIESDGLAESDSGWFAACRKIFDKLNRFYNGNIFKPRPELEAVVVANKTVHDIIRSLQPENSPYNFAVLPVEILGTIYERFLGRVVRTTEQRVKIEEKPEVRKAGGVYYTPQYIVEYIVKNTVGKLLEKCQTPAEAAKLKILDPACGSGSFLVGAYAVLIDWHIKYYDTKKRLSAADRADAYYDSDGRVRLTARLKRQILINNLFGVDIDQQAVEVTRFSLSLKALEDTRREELYEERSLFKETVLPDLNDNIKCGNSLIGPDYFSGKMFSDSEELRRVNPFDWQREFPDIFSSGGFDAVIGNPPYVRQEMLGDDFKSYVKGKYDSYAGTADLYVYFIEKSLKVLRENGNFGFICWNKWIRSNYGHPLRDLIIKESKIEQIIDFGELPVFEGASTFPAILLLKKERIKEQNFIYAPIKRLDFVSLSDEISKIGEKLNGDSIKGENWTLASSNEVELFEKMCQIGIPLGEYVNKKIYRGILTGLNEAFVIDRETRDRLISKDKKNVELIKPLICGDDVRKYIINFQGQYIILIPKGWTRQKIGTAKDPWDWFHQNYSVIANHLEPFAQKAQKRQDKGDYWWELRACDYYKLFEKPKIVYPDIAKESRMTMDYDGLFFGNTVYFIPIEDLYLLGVLNSSLIFHYFKRNATVIGDADKSGRLRWFSQDVLKLPIRKIDFSKTYDKQMHNKIVQMVKCMLDLNKKKTIARSENDKEVLQRQIDATDREIDGFVYELYNLSKEEVSLVNKSKLKKNL
ncbi:MAG: BREX-1 system adenine-specific DNA-methyltransferase PglX, partial [Thermodesulfovibrionales bacterium]|nr:BREX-1 system adenine-specific DNA-methyltransferase PglX [Thermodesulfovibrionales bacterium]